MVESNELVDAYGTTALSGVDYFNDSVILPDGNYQNLPSSESICNYVLNIGVDLKLLHGGEHYDILLLEDEDGSIQGALGGDGGQ